jgi:hypothetical protein
MERLPVKSSNIRSVGHDPQKNLMEVEFGNGRIYEYSDVNADEVAALLRAPSIGSHFASILKPVKAAKLMFNGPRP